MGLVANIKGPAGATGAQGAAGTPGSVWHNGTGVPADTVGADGDYYLDDGSGDVYVKAGGTWA